MVSFSAVAKRYPGGQEALKQVSFTLEAGELAFLTGRSGAGKSTLLKLIPAIERPTSGSVIVNGQNVGALKRAAVPYLRRNIGLLFQDQKLLYDRNVFDNVMLPLAFSGQAPREAARRVRAALDKVGLLARERGCRGRTRSGRRLRRPPAPPSTPGCCRPGGSRTRRRTCRPPTGPLRTRRRDCSGRAGAGQ